MSDVTVPVHTVPCSNVDKQYGSALSLVVTSTTSGPADTAVCRTAEEKEGGKNEHWIFVTAKIGRHTGNS
jgi:hypothetical protein